MNKFLKVFLTTLVSLTAVAVLFPSSVLADPIPQCPPDQVARRNPDTDVYECITPSNLTGDGGIGIGSITLPNPAMLDIGGLLVAALMLGYFAAGIFFLIQLLIGGISWLNAGGDPKALESARGRLTNAVIGIMIVVGAFAATYLITQVLGINIFQEGGVTIN